MGAYKEQNDILYNMVAKLKAAEQGKPYRPIQRSKPMDEGRGDDDD